MRIFNGLVEFIARILAFMYELPVVGGSYGLAIILLTLVVMVVLMPLTLKATRSTIKMQQIQPELRRLQKKYKQDKPTMNAEVMKLYSDNGISPVGGCLPMLAQLPVFLVLFNILRGLTRRIEDRPFFDLANRLRVARGEEGLNGRFFDPKNLATDSELYQDLQTDTEMNFGPFDLAERALDVLQSDFIGSLPYILMILFVVGSSYYQQRQVSARRTTDENAEVSPMMQQQQLLLKVLPLMSGIWSFLFPAGLVLYWATSNLFRIGQQSYITHQIYGKEAPVIEAEAKAKLGPKTDDDDDDDDSSNGAQAEKSEGASKNGASKNGGSKKSDKKKSELEPEHVDSASSGKTSVKDRDAAWEQRRQQKAKKKNSANPSTSSSRVTPKGTQAKKKKKR